MHRQISELTGRKIRINTGCLKSKTGKILLEEGAIMKRWNAYIRELYNGEREELTEESNLEVPPILKEEVADAMKHMKKGKTAGSDEITVEELEVLGEFGVDILPKC